MAEAIARRNASDVIEASSAGLEPLGFVAEMTKRVLVEKGYSVEGLQSKPILTELWDAADLVINISGRPRQLAFREPDKVEDWQVEDAHSADPRVFRRIREEIEGRVETLAERLRRAPQGMSGEVAERKKE
jgi:protein-tyrosine-phosphatase